jgi:hypothetical protein
VINRHAAPGQAAGYLYQCEHALLDLIEGAINRREVTLFLEKLDDIHSRKTTDQSTSFRSSITRVVAAA